MNQSLITKIILSLLCIASWIEGKTTALIYIAADNNLAPYADRDINEMKKIGSNKNLTILVFLNIKRPGEPKKTQRLVIYPNAIIQDGPTLEGSHALDSGDPSTLLQALIWSQNYPSDNLFVDIWDHGSGSLNRSINQHRGCCWDDTTGNYLTDLDYKSALDTFVNNYRSKKKIDILGFDCCLMADIEVAFTVKPYARYLVASQETIPGDGFNYATLFAPFKSSEPDAKSWAMTMVHSYNENYKKSGIDYTLSAINLSLLDAIVITTNTVAGLLNKLLKTSARAAIKKAIKKSVTAPTTPHFEEPSYIDLYAFYGSAIKQIPSMRLSSANAKALKIALIATQTAISKAILANATSRRYTKARGLSIYFPIGLSIEPSYYNLYWSKQTQWLNFLKNYVKA